MSNYACNDYSMPASIDAFAQLGILDAVIADLHKFNADLSLTTLVGDMPSLFDELADMISFEGTHIYSASFAQHSFDVYLIYLDSDTDMSIGDTGLRIEFREKDLLKPTPLFMKLQQSPPFDTLDYTSWVSYD